MSGPVQLRVVAAVFGQETAIENSDRPKRLEKSEGKAASGAKGSHNAKQLELRGSELWKRSVAETEDRSGSLLQAEFFCQRRRADFTLAGRSTAA